MSNDSYFKFNLDYMSFYNLVRYEPNGDNKGAYQIIRNYTASHQNAFFDLIDRALNSPDVTRDTEMQSLVTQWLERPRRDPYVDDTKIVKVCGSEACQPVPVPIRPTTDFLWQRDPFQLTGGGSGTIEGAGIDYILPYWMARYYGVITGEVVSAAASEQHRRPGLAGFALWREIGCRYRIRYIPTVAGYSGWREPLGHRCGRDQAHGTPTLRLSQPNQLHGSGWNGVGRGERGGYVGFGYANVHHNRGGRRARAVQFERNRRRCRERHCDRNRGRRSRVAVACSGVSMQQLRL